MKNEMLGEGTKMPKREMFDTKRNPNHKTFGRASMKGGTAYLKGGERGGPPVNEGSGPMEDDAASDRMEANEVGTENLKHNLGSERRRGYGNPQGGTTGEAKGGQEMEDETRGTHELPTHQYAEGHAVPQEYKERLSKALSHHRRR